MQQHLENKMGTAPVLQLVVSMSVPAMFSMLVQALYNIVDSIYVSHISMDALSAISLVFPLQMVMVALGVGTGVGINSLVARRLGEGRKREASNAATHGLLLGLCNWILIALIGIFGAEPFMRMYSDNANIVDMGTIYLRIVMILSFGVFIQICVEKTLQATGNMIYPMISQLVGCITNIILDPILIFGFFGLPAMGMAGAAIATVTGQIFAMCFCIYVLRTKNHDITVTFRHFRVRPNIIRDIYVVGVPAIVMQAISSVLVTFLNKILINFSTSAVNVLGVYYKLQSFVFMPVFGLTQGIMPILGYNFGAGYKKRMMDTLKIGIFVAIVIMTAGMFLFILAPEFLLNLFDADEATVSIGIPALRTISYSFLGAALGILFSTLFQAVGKGFMSLCMSLLRQLILILPVAYFLSKISLDATWWAFPIAECGSFLLGLCFFIHLYRSQLCHLQPTAKHDD